MVTGNVLLNDIDAIPSNLTAVLVGNVTQGNLTLNANGSFTYSPPANFTGPVTFQYRAFDGIAYSDPTTDTIWVTANRTLLALDGTYTMYAGGTLSGGAYVGTSTSAGGGLFSSLLANVYDTAGGALTYQKLTDPTNGNVTFNSNGSFVYTPTPGYIGPDSFTYRAVDTSYSNSMMPGGSSQQTILNSNTATIKINVADPMPGTGAGVANIWTVNDEYSVSHDQLLVKMSTYGVLANDKFISTGTVVVSQTSGPAHGTLNLSPSGAFTYLPSQGYVGKDSFGYRANNSYATVYLTVTNDPPKATDDTYTVAHDTQLVVPKFGGVLANDTDANGDRLSAVLIDTTSNGTLTLDPSGSFCYQPNPGFFGTDSFTYQANDGLRNSPTGVVFLTVTETAPKAITDNYSLTHDQTLTIPLSDGVAANDTDAQGDLLSTILVGGPQYGSLLLTPSGALRYTPNAGFVGTDSFLYRDNDGILNGNVALVTLQVNDGAPTVTDGRFSTLHDTTRTVDPLSGVLSGAVDPEGEPMTPMLVTTVAHGSLTLNPSGSFTYVPNAGFVGTDAFTFKVSDGLRQSNLATAYLNVTNAAPSASADRFTVAHDTRLTVGRWQGVLANDSDSDGDGIGASLVTAPRHGTLSLLASGAFSYQPEAGFVGTDLFTYQASDGLTSSAGVAVQLTVTGDGAPITADDTFSVVHDTPLVVTPDLGILNNDSVPSGRPVTLSVVDAVAHGSLTLNPGGTFLYTPATGFVGTDSFTYRLNDGMRDSAVAFVRIEVTDSVPAATAASYSVAQGRTLVVPQFQGLIASASDAEGDLLSVSLATNVANGTLTLNPSGSLSGPFHK